MSDDICLDLAKLAFLDVSDRDGMLDYMFDRVEDALVAGDEDQRWPSIENLLMAVDVETSSRELLIGLLSITLPIRKKSPARHLFANRVRDHFERTATADDDVEKLLRGLTP